VKTTRPERLRDSGGPVVGGDKRHRKIRDHVTGKVKKKTNGWEALKRKHGKRGEGMQTRQGEAKEPKAEGRQPNSKTVASARRGKKEKKKTPKRKERPTRSSGLDCFGQLAEGRRVKKESKTKKGKKSRLTHIEGQKKRSYTKPKARGDLARRKHPLA